MQKEPTPSNEIMPSVQALVNRMETNPDDFYNGKFKHTLIDIEEFVSGQPTRLFWFLNDAEKALLTESAKELVRKKWHETVMTDIFKEDVSREEEKMALRNLVQKGLLQPAGHWTDPRAVYGQRLDLQHHEEEPVSSISLNPAQVHVAKKMGIKLEDYAKQLTKLIPKKRKK